jgi:hypothetical protein
LNERLKNAEQLRASVMTKWLRQHNLKETQYLAGLMVSNYYYAPVVLFTAHGLIRTCNCKWKEYQTTLTTRDALFNFL